MVRFKASEKLTDGYNDFRLAASLGKNPLLLLLRLYWGFQFMQHGWGKLHNLAHVTQFFASLGIPFPGVMAPFVAGVEFFGGLLLVLGLASRVTALLLAGDMVVALSTAHRAALLAMFSNPDKFVAQAPVTFLIVALVVLTFGPGKFAIDSLRTRRDPLQLSREVIERRLEMTAHREAA